MVGVRGEAQALVLGFVRVRGGQVAGLSGLLLAFGKRGELLGFGGGFASFAGCL